MLRGMIISMLGFTDPALSVDVDFSKDTKSDNENDRTLIDKVSSVLQRANAAISKLKEYQGCAVVIRQALADFRNIELQVSTFQIISPNIETIGSFYMLSNEIGQVLNALLPRLLGEDSQNFQQHTTLVKLLADLLLFCLEFDQNKMLKPELQNDFSFYRRCLTQTHIENLVKPVSPDLAPEVSMWIADSLPIFGSLSPKTMSGVVVHPIPDELVTPLAHLANICCGMIQRQRCGAGLLSYVLKVMVASTILYDRVSENGAFHKKSAIRIGKVVTAIAKHGGTDKKLLQDNLKYSTTHFKDPNTPASIRKALDL